MTHKLSLALALSCVLGTALSGCVSTAPTTSEAPGMSPDGTTLEVASNEQIEQRLLSDYELIKQVSSQLNQNNIYDETMQPKNQSAKCLLPFLVNNEQGTVALYWDGACQDGHAVGLGRVVRTDNGKKTTELLVELKPNEPNTLYTYLGYSVLRAESEVGTSVLKLVDGKLQGHSSTLGYSDVGWADGHYDLSYRFEDSTNFVSYTKVLDLLNGESSLIIAYPNFSHDLLEAHDNVLSTIERTYRLLEGPDTVGLSYIWLKDGRLLVRDNSTNQDHIVTSYPHSLDDYVDRIKTEVARHTAGIDTEVNLGLKKLEQYHAQKCTRPTAFFRGDEVNQICDYLDNINHALAGLKAAKEERNASLESYRKHQEQILKELEQHLKALSPTKLATTN